MWEKWEPLLVNKPPANEIPDAPAKEKEEEKPILNPIVTPGQYELKAPKAGLPFLLWVPYDYTPDYSWPLIFCYHGAGGSMTLWPFNQVTENQGYIIVGMNYTPLINGKRNRLWIANEKAHFLEVLEIVSARLNIYSEMIFMGGYSQGGYQTTLLGEKVLDKLAGLVILGAGRFFIDHTEPPRRKIRDKPVFIGVGENDTIHNPRAKRAAANYERWGAEVTFEEWPGVGHGIGTPVFPSKLLPKWLEDIFSASTRENQDDLAEEVE